MSSEKFCLKWNDFETNISKGFQDLRNDKDFFDVTLACEDDQISAHKVILSACSSFFRTILLKSSHPHPLLYMKGVRFTDLESVLDFMYHGEVNIAQDDLNNFLAVAEDLRVKGLTQNTTSDSNSTSSFNPPISGASSFKPKTSERSVITSRGRVPVQDDEEDIQEVFAVKTESALAAAPEQLHDIAQYEGEGGEDYGHYDDSAFVEAWKDAGQEQIVIKDGQSGLTSPADFDQYLNNLGAGSYSCTLCSYVKSKTLVRFHVESIHFPNTFSYNCPHCGKNFGTHKAYVVHKNRIHKGE